jgi:hypothetical protein
MFIKMRYCCKIIGMFPYKRYMNLKKSYIIHTFYFIDHHHCIRISAPFFCVQY